MQPGVKYSIVCRSNGVIVDGYIIDNIYFMPTKEKDVQVGEVVDGSLHHRAPVKANGGCHVLRVDGLTLIDEQGSVFDLVAQ